MHAIIRNIAFLLLLIVPFASIEAQVLDAPPFSDISNHQNRDAITYVYSEGIVQGYSDGTFRPDQKINRAEFTKILIEAVSADFNPAECRKAQSFPDVPLNAWFHDYVCIGKDRGYVAGYPDGTFKPNYNINFAEAAKIIAHAFDLPVTMTDIWYEGYVRALETKKAIPLSITSFNQEITRGEMAEMIYRLQAGITSKESRTYGELAGTVRPISFTKYRNEEYGFVVDIPADATVNVYGGSLQDSIVFESGSMRYAIAIRKDAAKTDIHSFFFLDTPIDGYGKFGGETAVISRATRGFCDAGSCGSPFAVISAKKGNFIYSLEFIGDAEFSDDEQAIIRSFAFLPSAGGEVERTVSYQNLERGWSVEYPSDWTVHEDAELPGTDTFVDVDGRWTLFQAPGNTQAHVFVAFPNVCPSLSSSFLARSTTHVINGRTFVRAGGSDGAAGSIGEYAVYLSKQPASPCVALVTSFFHSTGDAEDEPWRSQTKAANAEVQQSIEQIVQSFRDL